MMLDDLTTLDKHIRLIAAHRQASIGSTLPSDPEQAIANVEAYLSVTEWHKGVTIDTEMTVSEALDIIDDARMGDDLFEEW